MYTLTQCFIKIH